MFFWLIWKIEALFDTPRRYLGSLASPASRLLDASGKLSFARSHTGAVIFLAKIIWCFSPPEVSILSKIISKPASSIIFLFFSGPWWLQYI